MTELPTPGVAVRPGGDRFATRVGRLDSRHSFSFGPHLDPRNTHFGLLLVCNDDVVGAGAGYGTHPHRDTEIVTWVLAGALVHQDSEGHSGVVRPGLAQRLSAGRGVLHSETNDSWRVQGGPPHTEPVRFVQMWVAPDTSGLEPGYEQLDIGAELDTGGLVTVASGLPGRDTAIRIAQEHAALHAARLGVGDTVEVPTAPYVHLYVARGAIGLEGAGPLRTGDAARLTATEGQRVTATSAGTEILVWEMHATLADQLGSGRG